MFYLLSTDPANAGVGGGTTPPAAPAAPATPAVPQNLTPVVAPPPPAAAPPSPPPAAAPQAPAGQDGIAVLQKLLEEKLKPVADIDNKVSMLVKTTLYELGFRPPEKDKRGPGRPPAARQDPPPAVPPPAAPQPGAAPPAQPGTQPPASGSSLEADALRTQLAEMQAQIENANKQLAEAKVKEERAQVEAHLTQVRSAAEKILTSSSIGMLPDSAAQAARVLMDLDRAIQEDGEGNLFLKYKDDNGKEVTKPLLEGLQAWSNTRAGRVYKPIAPQGSGVGQFVRDKLQAIGRAPVNAQQNNQNNFQNAWSQQKAGITK